MAPTTFVDVDNGMRLARDEIFGPVAAILPFESEQEAIAIANDTPYGLAAGVWTNDVRRAHRVAHALRFASTVWVNASNQVMSEAPFGGFGDSGWGRENGFEVLNDYTEVKHVYVSLDTHPADWFAG